MQLTRTNIGRLALLVACGALVAWAGQAVAQDESSVMVAPTPAPAEATEAPAMPAPATTTPAPAAESAPTTAPAPAATTEPVPAAEPADLLTPCIDYRTHHSAKKLLRCNPQVKVVMVAQNPADCCLYEVPLCIPCCCEGEPCVTSECGILGRGIVTYTWPCCGFEAKVVIKDCGDVTVHYRG